MGSDHIYSTAQTPYGAFCFVHNGQHIFHAQFGDIALNVPLGMDIFAQKVQSEVTRYFLGHAFSLELLDSLSPTGTDFQLAVWDALTSIPYGTTRSYGYLAEMLCTSARAVGQACRLNPIPLFIPCHRVVAKTGLGGFMGKSQRLDLKKNLLESETRTRS